MNFNNIFCPFCYSGLDFKGASKKHKAELYCTGCSAKFFVFKKGIVNFMDTLDDNDYLNKEYDNNQKQTYERYHDQGVENIDYDSLEEKKIESLFKKMEINQDEIILEICCGTGKLSKQLSNYNKNIELILADFSTNALEKIQLKEFGIKESSISVCCTDVLNLPLAESSVDRVIISNTMHCWTDRRIRLAVLFQAYRALKQGGRIDILFVHNRWPKIFAPGCYLNMQKLKTHILGTAQMYCPLYPFELEAEVSSLFSDIDTRPSVTASRGGFFSFLEGINFYEKSMFNLLSKDSFDLSAVKV